MINILDLGVDAPDGSYDHGGQLVKVMIMMACKENCEKMDSVPR